MPLRFMLLALIVPLAASAAPSVTKMREGFATMLIADGTSLIPRNPTTRAQAGDDVYYWIQWKEPVPRSQLRCVITGPDTNIDETEFFLEPQAEGFSVCGMESEDSDSGTFTFTQYLDGEKVGQSTIYLEKRPFFRSVRQKWKWLTGALGAVILAAYWVRRKMTGDTRSLSDVMGGKESPAKAAARDALVIGSKVGAAAAAPAAAPPGNEAEELRKAGLQFQTMIGQPDKAKGLELGRRYIAMLLKAKNETEALKAFKACVAADPAFRLSQAEDVLPLAKAARAAKDPHAAIAAVRGFDKAFPGHAQIPDVFVFSAKLLAEDMNNPAMARKILEHVLQKYPGHYLAQEAKRYLQSMPQSA